MHRGICPSRSIPWALAEKSPIGAWPARSWREQIRDFLRRLGQVGGGRGGLRQIPFTVEISLDRTGVLALLLHRRLAVLEDSFLVLCKREARRAGQEMDAAAPNTRAFVTKNMLSPCLGSLRCTLAWHNAKARSPVFAHHYVIGISICFLKAGRSRSRSNQVLRFFNGGRSIGKACQR